MTSEENNNAMSQQLAIAFFGHDWNESTVIKRANAFMAHGAKVTGFMFHRVRRRATAQPKWNNIDLGETHDRSYAQRLPRLLRGLVRAVRHWPELRGAQVFYARNIDMLFIAVMAKTLTRSPAIVVYEALDVQPVFVGTRPINRLFRWAERRLLAACNLVVVSAPDHMTEYFQRIQGYRGDWRLLENKVADDPALSPATGIVQKPAAAPPWVIGFFGVLRCVRSLEILQHLAAKLPDSVVIHLRGQVSETDIPRKRLEELTARYPNIVFHGPYSNPHDLAGIYGQIHFAWAIDYIAAESNSRWSLLNRFYEGGLFAAVPLGRAGTATGRLMQERGFGRTFDEPLEDNLVDFFRSLDLETYAGMRARLSAAPRAMFVDETDTRDLLRALQARSNNKQSVSSRSAAAMEPRV